jgi:hypothetical protein
VNLAQRITRILATRLGERVCEPTYGSDLYRLRDRALTQENRLLFAKYCKEAIEKWESVKVTKVELKSVNVDNGVFSFALTLDSGETITGIA